jgi:hypothetical protein
MFALCTACDEIVGLTRPGDPADSGDDANHLRDGGADAPDAKDISSDGATVYNDWRSHSLWSTFDTTTLGSKVKSFVGGAFDGRYIYIAPANGEGWPPATQPEIPPAGEDNSAPRPKAQSARNS